MQAWPYEAALGALEATDAPLADYIRQTRTWSERLQQTRISIEHHSFVLPGIQYTRKGNTIEALPPTISGQVVSEFVSFIFDRMTCFAEELTAYCIQRQMPPTITIAEVPIEERTAESPERFRVTLASGGMRPWRITYHQAPFEEV